MADDEQDVRLEFVGSVEMDAHRVMKCIQELKDVPADAWCDIQSVWSKPQQGGAPNRGATYAVATTVQMRCERRVADFLCHHFSKQTRHVSQGELLLVRCRRVFLRSLPTTDSTKRTPLNRHDAKTGNISTNEDGALSSKADEKRSPALSRSTMVDLLDCLGDRIVDVLDAFQAHAEQNGATPQLTMIGLIQALTQLSKQEWTVNTAPRLLLGADDAKQTNSKQHNDQRGERLAVQKVRHLLTHLIAHKAVAQTSLPVCNDTPFLPYTDFIACFVASMNTTSTGCGAT